MLFLIFWCPVGKSDLAAPFWKLCFDHVPQPSSFWKNFYCSAKALAFFWTYLQLCTITHHHKRFADVISYIKEIEKNDLNPSFLETLFWSCSTTIQLLKKFLLFRQSISFLLNLFAAMYHHASSQTIRQCDFLHQRDREKKKLKKKKKFFFFNIFLIPTCFMINL